jgi:glycine dehydrogenase subunit 1
MTISHPYMPNSTSAAREALLRELGAASVDELFDQIPGDQRLQRPLLLPPAIASELELRRHLEELLSRNVSCDDALSFLGGGIWRHYVPAVCDEIVRRSEFLTSVWGTPSSDHGRNQAWFEFCSQLGELLGFDMVGLPVYSWGCAAGNALRMAARMTKRRRVLVSRIICPERMSIIHNYCGLMEMFGSVQVELIDHDPRTGLLSLDHLRDELDATAAALYLETPSYLGLIEHRMGEIAEMIHAVGAELIVGVDPISLGVLAPPSEYGADIAVGSTQSLGVHMSCGGGVGGFIASRDEPRYVYEYPTLNLSITDTVVPGERGFAMALMHQSSYGSREKGKDWTGNSTYLWAIASAVYMSMLGPRGFEEIGEVIMQRARYAAQILGEIDGVRIPYPSGFLKEFVVDFTGTGLSVSAINRALREESIFGGQDLSHTIPDMGQAALYCVTEMHTKADIDRLAASIAKVVSA